MGYILKSSKSSKFKPLNRIGGGFSIYEYEFIYLLLKNLLILCI
jgi:hypothetical protein